MRTGGFDFEFVGFFKPSKAHLPVPRIYRNISRIVREGMSVWLSVFRSVNTYYRNKGAITLTLIEEIEDP